MRVSKQAVAKRCLRGECPNCGGPGLFEDPARRQQRVGFKLNNACACCGALLQEEHGLTLGTTSIGYVLAFFVVVLPAIVAGVSGATSVWVAVGWGVAGSIMLPVLLYPFLLRVVLAVWFGFNAGALPCNQPRAEAEDV